MFLFYWWISKLTRKYEIFWQKKTHQMTAGKFVENKALTGQIAWDWRCNSSVGRFQRWFYWGQNHENHPIFGVCVFFWRSFFLRLEIFFSSASCWGAQISMGISCFFWPPFKEPIGGEIWVKFADHGWKHPVLPHWFHKMGPEMILVNGVIWGPIINDCINGFHWGYNEVEL